MDILNLLVLGEFWVSLSIHIFVSFFFFFRYSGFVKVNSYFPKALYPESTGAAYLLPLFLSFLGAGSTGSTCSVPSGGIV